MNDLTEIEILLPSKSKPSFSNPTISETNICKYSFAQRGFVSPWYMPIGNGVAPSISSIRPRTGQNWLFVLLARGIPSILTFSLPWVGRSTSCTVRRQRMMPLPTPK